MTIWERLMGWLWQARERPPEAVEARELAHRIAARADELNRHLQTYQRSRDPFAALMADMYNRDQIERIYRGHRS